VLRPADPGAFNGTVLVEWLNVSGGIDAPAVWFMAHREITRAGYGYVAVSAQRVGVEGGDSLGFDFSLKKQDPEKYAGLHHPGDAYAYDIFTQAGQLVRETALPGLPTPEHVVAMGESQSAMFLTTYVNDVDGQGSPYDGYLVSSRFGPAAPLDGGSALAQPGAAEAAVRFRSDLRVPVLTVITETDLVDGALSGYHRARRPDGDDLRAWEVPGAAHADNYTINVSRIDTGTAPVAELAAAYTPTKSLFGQDLEDAVNFAPQHHYVLQAALDALITWIRTGRPAPAAAPIELTDTDPPALVLDENRLATGGVRTPWVDVPVAWSSGLTDHQHVLAGLFGSAGYFDDATLTRLYPGGVADYLERFEVALDAAIDAGFLLAADRAEILELAAHMYPHPGA
jgi:hypothetical protein